MGDIELKNITTNNSNKNIDNNLKFKKNVNLYHILSSHTGGKELHSHIIAI